MKTKKEEITARSAYKRYTSQFKEQALERTDRDGVPKVAQDLGVAEATLYAWKAKRRQTGQPFEDQKLQQAELARLKRENARLEEEVAFLKKAAAYPSRKGPQVKYAMIKTNEMHFPVGMMCRLLSVSRSGYYAWKRRPPSVREQSTRLLKIEIKRVFDDEKGRPGSHPGSPVDCRTKANQPAATV